MRNEWNLFKRKLKYAVGCMQHQKHLMKQRTVGNGSVMHGQQRLEDRTGLFGAFQFQPLTVTYLLCRNKGITKFTRLISLSTHRNKTDAEHTEFDNCSSH